MQLLIYRCFHSAEWDYGLIFLPLFPLPVKWWQLYARQLMIHEASL